VIDERDALAPAREDDVLPALEPEASVEPLPAQGARRAVTAVVAVLLVVGVLAAAILIAGGEGDTLETVAVGETVPLGRLSQASSRTDAVSYRIEGTMEMPAFFGNGPRGEIDGGGTRGGGWGPSGPTMTVTVTVEHDATTGRLRSVVKSDGGFGMLNATTILDGDAMYFSAPVGLESQLPAGKTWVRGEIPEGSAPDAGIYGALSGSAFIDAIVEEGAVVTYAGKEQVRGTTTDKYVVSGMDEQSTEGTVWIDGDGRMRRLRFDTGGAGFATDMYVKDFGSDITVDLPDPSQVVSEDAIGFDSSTGGEWSGETGQEISG